MLQIFVLLVSLSLDLFAASLSYAVSGIKIPPLSALILSFVGAAFLGFSLFLANITSNTFSPEICRTAAVIILAAMGFWNIFSISLKRKIAKNGGKTLFFKCAGINFALNLCLDETLADLDKSKILSPKEALLLAVTLSLDSLVTGFSVGLGISYKVFTVTFCFIFALAAIVFGGFLGKKLSAKTSINLSWLGGAVLIFLAIVKAFNVS
ncbi:MAG: manganese efflux pump [Oscillospiraceae bacterium]